MSHTMSMYLLELSMDHTTLAYAILTLLAVIYTVAEKVEKRGMVRHLGLNGEAPEWAKHQNEVLVLIAEHTEGIDPEAVARYLNVKREPTIRDIREEQ